VGGQRPNGPQEQSEFRGIAERGGRSTARGQITRVAPEYTQRRRSLRQSRGRSSVTIPDASAFTQNGGERIWLRHPVIRRT
jgi:hypothetical protein